MRLLVDIGNTQVKYVFQDTAESPFSDIVYADYQIFLAQLLQENFSGVTQIILANVQGQEIQDSIRRWADENKVEFLQVESTKQAFGVTSGYEIPERLGVDRWLAMIGAKQLYPNENLLIIDAGTATTVDLLAGSGQHYGGWIMPGIETLFDSLVMRTKRIDAIASTASNLAFGVNSSACVNHGSWAMTIGAVKEAITQANNIMKLDKILLTGGNGQEIVKLITDNCQLESELIFHGLRCFKPS